MKELTRRGFIGMGAVAALGTAAGLAGCGSNQTGGTPDDAEAGSTTGAAADDTYARRTSGIDRFKIASVSKAEAGAPVDSVDWVVVGGGNAGLFAAAHGADLGMKTILLEKNSMTGGAGVGTEVAMAFSDCKAAEGIENFSADISELYHYFMMHNYWESNALLVTNYFHRNKDVHDWLLDHEATPFLMLPQGALDAPSGGIMYEGQGNGVCEALLAAGKKLGVDVRTSTSAKRLVMDGDAVVGVIVDSGGSEAFIEAKAVFVATGGFGTNPDMVHFYIGGSGDIASKRDEQMGIPHDGDGICMMFGAGAIEADNMHTSAPAASAVKGDVIWESEVDRAGREPYLWVNNAGKRMGNEKWIAMDITYKMADKEPSHSYWNIFDSAAARRMETQDFMTGARTVLGENSPMPAMTAELDSAAERGIIVKADTIEGLADKCGIDADSLAETLARYNKMCESGEDTEFWKPADYLLAITEPPFYAIEEVPAWYATLNGVKINERFEVLNSDDQAIPGLYAGGADSSQFFKVIYNHGFGGSDSAFSYFSGFCAAETAQEYIRA